MCHFVGATVKDPLGRVQLKLPIALENPSTELDGAIILLVPFPVIGLGTTEVGKENFGAIVKDPLGNVHWTLPRHFLLRTTAEGVGITLPPADASLKRAAVAARGQFCIEPVMPLYEVDNREGNER